LSFFFTSLISDLLPIPEGGMHYPLDWNDLLIREAPSDYADDSGSQLKWICKCLQMTLHRYIEIGLFFEYNKHEPLFAFSADALRFIW
jgi:hypothetical protein